MKSVQFPLVTLLLSSFGMEDPGFCFLTGELYKSLRAREAGELVRTAFTRNPAVRKALAVAHWGPGTVARFTAMGEPDAFSTDLIRCGYERALGRLPLDGESYEHNSLMFLLPTALAGRDTSCKNKILEIVLSTVLPRQIDLFYEKKYAMVALVEAGADVNLRLGNVSNGLSAMICNCLGRDSAFAKSLLRRGLDPANRVYSGNNNPLWHVQTRALAELLVNNGARVDAVKAHHYNLLNQALSNEGYEPELLSFYIEKGLCVRDHNGMPDQALTLLIRYYSALARMQFSGWNKQRFIQKVSILLDAGADIDACLSKISEEYKYVAQIEPVLIARGLINEHAARLRMVSREMALDETR